MTIWKLLTVSLWPSKICNAKTTEFNLFFVIASLPTFPNKSCNYYLLSSMQNLYLDKLGFELQLSCIILDKILAFINFNCTCNISGNNYVNFMRILRRLHDKVLLAEHLPHKRQWLSDKSLLTLRRLNLLLWAELCSPTSHLLES